MWSYVPKLHVLFYLAVLLSDFFSSDFFRFFYSSLTQRTSAASSGEMEFFG